MKMEFNCATQKGLREINEDAYYVGKNKNEQILAIVCDGIGGYECSDTASNIIIDSFKYFFENSKKITNFQNFYYKCIEHGQKILNNAYNEIKKTMGTTIVVSLIDKNKIQTANIGDTRGYIINGNEIIMLSKDHNYLNFLSDNCNKMIKIDPKNKELYEFNFIKEKNENKDKLLSLTKSISPNNMISELDTFFSCEKLQDNSIVILMSDGVYNYVVPKNITSCVNKNFNTSANDLINIALKNKSNDNLTCIIVR